MSDPATACRNALQAALAALPPGPATALLPQLALEVVAHTGSTNADLLARCATLDGPTLRLALAQSAGRGRSGRAWLSAPGHSLTFSVAWRFALPLHALLGLSLVCGLAVAEALQALGVSVRLKWPNDLLKDGRKLGGILIETSSAHRSAFDPFDDANWAVIGIGLNLRLDEAMEAQIGQPAADARWLAQMPLPELLAHLLAQLLPALDAFAHSGLPPFVARWNALHAHAGQMVRILDHGQLLHQGMAMGIDARGRLLLQQDDGSQQAVLAGDVSLRPAEASP